MDALESIGKFAEWIVPTIVAVAAFVKYCRNSKDAHARAMLELVREFQREHADAFYTLVERKDSEFYGGNLTFDTTENERKADALLLFLENILHLHANGNISDSEFIHFEYYLKRVIGDPDISRYLHDFGVTCSEGGTVNPFVRILDYCSSHAAFKSMRVDTMATCSPSDGNVDENDANAASEDGFESYLIRHYHGMTRTAKSVKSRVDHHLLRNGWSYANPPKKSDLLHAITDAGKDYRNADMAASVKSALRQYFRASFDEELVV